MVVISYKTIREFANSMKTKKEYEMAMSRIDALMKKGESKLNKQEAYELRKLALAAQKYEKASTPSLHPKPFRA